MNENNVIDALNSYDGTQPSLEKTIDVLTDELGPDWANDVFEKLGDLPVELKEKLDHAFNYYASLTAWQEAQSYLEQTEPLDVEMMNERLPILEHWLDFFGEPGQNLYKQLQNRFEQQKDIAKSPISKEQKSDDGQDLNEESAEIEEPSQSLSENEETKNVVLDEPISNSNQISSTDRNIEEAFTQSLMDEKGIENVHDNLPDVDIKHSENTGNSALLNQISNETLESEEVPIENVDDNSPEGFAVHKAEREIILLDDLQAWLAARCLQLGDIENFAYPYYGLVVDLMRQTVKDIQAVLDLENQDKVLQYYPDGLESLTRKKQAIESDIQTAVENCESDTTALIEAGMDMDKVKKALGDLDESQEKEYLGPAPDGFELLDDKPIDEKAVKEQYEQLEEKVQKNTENEDISVVEEKKTSQNEQNGVQRKLSFSLKPKKG